MTTQNVGPFVTVIKKIVKSAGDALIHAASQHPQGSKDSPSVLEMLSPTTADSQKILCPALCD